MASHATKPANITNAERALVPTYCKDTMDFAGYGDRYHNTSPRAGYWVSVMGETFWAMHHYCWALIHVSRATRPGVRPVLRQGMLENARGDYHYVLNYAKDDFALLPEVLTRLGEVELLLRDPNAARAAFARAWTVKPDYWPPYHRWAEFLQQNGARDKAKEVLLAGLKQAPAAAPLRVLYRELGGDLAAIEAAPEGAAAPARPAESGPETAAGAPVEQAPADRAASPEPSK